MEAIFKELELEQQRQQHELQWVLERTEVRDRILRSIMDRFHWRQLRPSAFPPNTTGV